MTVGQSPGSFPHSGSVETPESPTPPPEVPKRKRPHSGNGKARTRELELLVASLQADNERLAEEVQDFKRRGFGEREHVMLHALKYMYGALVNFQCLCAADRNKIDRLLEEVRHIMEPRETSHGRGKAQGVVR
jgi:hypothetical protein